MEVVKKVEEVTSLDDNIHWFCPRYGADDGSIFFDEDRLADSQTSKESEDEQAKRQSNIDAAVKRTELVLEACTILAFDGDDARPFQDKFKDSLSSQLVRCDVCVREYHRARSKLRSQLEGEYDTDEVQSFMETFDGVNKSRIKKGLDTAKDMLLKLSPEQRNITTAGEEGMYALFEALHCIPFLEDEEALEASFDTPFQLVQSRKKVKLPSYSPGMVAFLFSDVDVRSSWAHRNYGSIKRNVMPVEFDYCVKPFLERSLSRVHISYLDVEFLPLFWKGTYQIITKLSSEVITSKLRALKTNLWTLSLEHFQLDKPHLPDLVQTYTILLETSPTDFWSAMGSINSQAVLETIFKAKQLERVMSSPDEGKDKLRSYFTWVEPFIASIQANNLTPPARTLADQFLKRYHQTPYSEQGRKLAFELGLTAILKTLNTLREQGSRGPIVSQMLDLISKDHLNAVMSQLEGIEKKDEMRLSRTTEISLGILEFSLTLDCRSLQRDRITILQTRGADHELTISNLSMWNTGLRNVKPGHPALAATIMAGTQDLLGIEKLAPRQVEVARKYAEKWNTALDRIQKHMVDDFLERLQSFPPDELLELFQDQRAGSGMFALLFNGEPGIHQPALDLIKTISGEDSRRGALMYLTKGHLRTTLNGVVGALRIIARTKCFAPCSTMLKLGTDIYSCLCDDTDGILRSGRSYEKSDISALESLWQASWVNLSIIFEQTEAWSNLGFDKSMMQEFCRSTMDFAEYTFDQYPLFANAINLESAKDSLEDIQKRLLDRPKAVFTNAAKWLRLRDDYLIAKAMNLTCKMLLRLEEAKIKVSKEAGSFIEDVLTGKIKTKMSMNQKAEVQRALENHFGELLSETLDTAAQTQKKQSNLQGFISPAPTSGRSTPSEDKKPSKSGTIDVDAWSAAAKKPSQSQLNDLLDQSFTASKQWQQHLDEKKKKPAPVKSIPTSRAKDDERRRLEFKLKRQHDKEEAERQRAAALAKANGIGAGSGVLGLGNIGKDHSLKGQNVMVSSSEESDDDDMDEDLFGPKIKKEKKPRPSNNGDLDQLGLKPDVKRAPTRIQRTQRSLKDMRARLAPNLQELHRTILKWDFFHEGDYPPASNEHQFKEVSNVFTDPVSYQNTFQPLLTLEAWQGMVRAREENTFKTYQIKVQGRSNVDKFLEISSSVSHAENKELQLSEGDIVLLSESKKPTDHADCAHCLARIYRIKRQKAHLEVTYQLMPGGSLDRQLTTQSVVQGVKVQSIIPLEREYGALQGLQYYDLCNQIVRARPSDRVSFSDKQIGTYQDIWNVNRAQSEAINAALINEGFSLIQGPPGSGKTKTIIAIVGGLLSDALRSNKSGAKISVPGQTNGSKANDTAPKKLLVCAPSNAAVDELVMRLKDGVTKKDGRKTPINVVRIGRSDAINAQVLDVTMDELVSKRLGTSSDDENARAKTHDLFKEHEKISAELRSLHEKKDSGELKGKEASELQDKILAVRKRKNELGSKIDNVKDQERNAGREAELNRKKAQQAVLDQAHVICATLSGSGHDMFQNLNIEFETIIIDEAAQCVEMSSLIPLKYGCIKCIMVGDPKQLPPTVFSKEAARFQYEQSLFVRMQKNFPDEIYLLDTQYRMHPDISVFPSRTFYDGLLKDGKGMAGLRQQPWHASDLLAPYRFFDVQGQHQTVKGHSLVNIAEIDVALALYARLRTDFSSYDLRGKIGIITPYKSQLRALKDRFAQHHGRDILDSIDFNTTDAYQGRESEIIIFSCVRASPAGGIGFLQDIRRMNVGLTRAKSSLWVLGNSDSLIRGRYWKQLVDDARSRDLYTTGDVLGMLSRPSSHFKATTKKDQSMHDVATPRSDGQPGAKDDSRMEGITYRFEDRVKNKRPASPGVDSDRPGRPRVDRSSHADGADVEMADASDTGRENPLVNEKVHSRGGTPKPTTGNAPARQSESTGSTAAAPPRPPQQSFRRVPNSDPFMPRKR